MRTSSLILFSCLLSLLHAGSIHPQWIQTNGPFGGLVHSLAVSGTNLFAGTDIGGVFLYNGTSWIDVNTGLTNLAVEALSISGTNLFAGTHGGVFLSTNNGTNWTAVNTGLTTTYVQSLAVSGTNLFAGTLNSVFLSTNNGTTWTQAGLTNTSINAFAVSGTNLFAGTDGSGVFLSTNNGTSWTAVNTGLTLPSDVYAFSISGTNLFAGTNRGVFLSTNNGTNWTEVGLTDTIVNAFAMSGTNLFAGTAGYGVLLSTNSGTSWDSVNTGLLINYVESLVVSDTNLFAGADDVWRRPLSEMITSVRLTSDERPAQFELHQNYPNPFNPTTKIVFRVASRELVSLKVYTLLGQDVATLVNEELNPGSYEATWDAAGFASGVYFYRLFARDVSSNAEKTFVETKKLMLVR